MEEQKEKEKVKLSNYRSAKDTDFIKNEIGETYEEKSELQKEIIVDFFTKTVTPRIKPKFSVLDLGCGTGNNTVKFLPLVGDGGRIVGSDVSEGMIKKAREKNKEIKNISFEVADCLTFSQEPFIRDSDLFDIVFSSHMLHWVEDKKSVFHQIFSSLKPGGRFIGTFGIVMSPETPTSEIVNECCDIVLTEKPEHVEVFMDQPGVIRKVLEEAGFEIETFDFFFPIVEFKGKDDDEVRQRMVNHYETVFTMGCYDKELHQRLLRLIAKKTFEVADTKDHRWSNIQIEVENESQRVNYYWVERNENGSVMKMRVEIIEFVARKK